MICPEQVLNRVQNSHTIFSIRINQYMRYFHNIFLRKMYMICYYLVRSS